VAHHREHLNTLMSNTFAELPTIAGNGPGEAVDMNGFGPLKTITVTAGDDPRNPPIVTIEVSNEPSPVHWATLTQFRQPGSGTFEVACRWMRSMVSSYRSGSASLVEVGGTGEGVTFGQVIAPSSNGMGSGFDVSALGPLKTFQVGGPFTGSLNFYVSVDGGATYQQFLSFSKPGIQTVNMVAGFLRVSRNGVLSSPVLPAPKINIAAGVSTNPETGAMISASPTTWGGTVTAGQSNVPLDAAGGGTQIMMIRPGSIVGLSWIYAGPITAGSLTVQITKNGSPVTLSSTGTSTENTDGGFATEGASLDTYDAGDLLGMSYTSSGDLDPAAALTSCFFEIIEIAS
jgi:hypothetical protein